MNIFFKLDFLGVGVSAAMINVNHLKEALDGAGNSSDPIPVYGEVAYDYDSWLADRIIVYSKDDIPFNAYDGMGVEVGERCAINGHKNDGYHNFEVFTHNWDHNDELREIFCNTINPRKMEGRLSIVLANPDQPGFAEQIAFQGTHNGQRATYFSSAFERDVILDVIEDALKAETIS